MRQKAWLLIVLLLLVAGCISPTPSPAKTQSEPTADVIEPFASIGQPSLTYETTVQPADQTPTLLAVAVGYINLTAEGNRLISGMRTIPITPFVDIEVEGLPKRIVGVPFGPNNELELVDLLTPCTCRPVVDRRYFNEYAI